MIKLDMYSQINKDNKGRKISFFFEQEGRKMS